LFCVFLKNTSTPSIPAFSVFADLQFQLTMQAEAESREEELRAQIRDLTAKVRIQRQGNNLTAKVRIESQGK
jgi:hypothetical protein